MSSGILSHVFLIGKAEKIAEPPARPLILLELKAKGGTGADHLDLIFFFSKLDLTIFWTFEVAAVSERPIIEKSIS